MHRLLISVAVALLVGFAADPGTAHAHSGKQSYLYVSVFDDGIDGRVEVPVAQLASTLDVDIANTVSGARSAIGDLTPTIREYVSSHTHLGDDAGTWRIDFAEQLSILPTENGPYVVVDFAVAEEFDSAPESFVADFSVIIESDDEKDALLIIEDDWASATIDNGSDPLLSFSVGMTRQTVELGGASTLESMGEVRGVGTDAIRAGIDLMLVVVAIILMGVMALASKNDHTTGGAVTRRAVGLLVVLTIAQTPTLWLTGLGVITPTARPVSIAVVIALAGSAALSVAARLRTVSVRVMAGVAAVVGSIHGFGLGQFFVDEELDRRRTVLSLVAFQFGAIAAVIAVLACVVVPMLLLRSTRFATAFTIAMGVVLAGFAIAWFGERVLSDDWPIEEIANPLRVWPRNLWFVALAIAAAALIRRLDRHDPTDPIEESATS